MWAQVFLLPRDGSSVVSNWEEKDFPRINDESWDRSALAWPSRHLEGATEELRCFICMIGDPSEDGYDSNLIRGLLYRARRHTWNAPIYVALDQRLDLQKRQIPARAARLRWLETMWGQRVTDIIELPLFGESGEGLGVKLMHAAARSDARIGALGNAGRAGQWKCLLHSPSEIEKSFLDPFFALSPSTKREENYLLIVREEVKNGHETNEQLEFVEQALSSTSDGKFLVALNDKAGEQPSDGLRRLCEEKGVMIIPDAFRGLFELRFFIQRLNQSSRDRQPRPIEGTEVVRLAALPRFVPSTPRSQLMITHSFDPYDEESHCIEAARDVYEMTENTPTGTDVLVHPAITCATFPVVISSLQYLTAWVHIGHGAHGKGLLESGDEKIYRTPEQWLACFQGYRGSLSLICFASCNSIEIARRFAEAGAGVAVGFAAGVMLPASRMLYRDLIAAALTSYGNREKILEAFELGRSKLLANNYLGAGPTAFCSKY